MRRYFRNLWNALLGIEQIEQAAFPVAELAEKIVLALRPQLAPDPLPLRLPAAVTPVMTGWKCWVVNGAETSEWNSEEHKIEKVPAVGMQAVMVNRSDGTKVFLRKAKYYIWKTDTVIATMNPVRLGVNVKEGTRIEDYRFKALMQRTM